ncbi:hypothetical protein FB480_102122 [Agrobacterium vitis]|nr:hypothetical protein FB480_102122 [Agrobacterium vitis]
MHLYPTSAQTKTAGPTLLNAGGTGGVCVSAFFGAPFSKSPLDFFSFTMHEACQT